MESKNTKSFSNLHTNYETKEDVSCLLINLKVIQNLQMMNKLEIEIDSELQIIKNINPLI